MVMKRAVKLGRSVLALMVCKPLITALSNPLMALACCRAAQRDENDGYELTAAMEWRKAALLLAPFPAVANRCWQQWERVMRLPRRLAGPQEV